MHPRTHGVDDVRHALGVRGRRRRGAGGGAHGPIIHAKRRLRGPDPRTRRPDVDHVTSVCGRSTRCKHLAKQPCTYFT
nr:hypothetical protein [Angustibacter aerolatus]